MSQGFAHSDATGIDREEHIGDDGRNRRAVGLFAKDPGGMAIELSAISTASGVAIPTYELNPTTPTLTLGSVTLNPSDSQIGSVTIFGNITTTQGMTTIFGGPNQIGSVTISNTPSVAQSGNWDIRSALSVASIYGRVEQTNFTAPNIGNVTLNPSPSFIGIVTVANPNAVSGNTTINPGPNQIGSVTISNVPAVTQSGNWDVRSVLSLASIYGTVGITGTPNVTFTGLISLASGTEVKSVATVNQGAAAWRSVVTISPRTDYIGLMSISGNVAVSNWVSPNVGNVTLNASDAKIGLVTVANQIDVRSMLSTATIFAVVNTSAAGNTNALATLLAGPNQIGSVTISNFTAPNTGNVTLNPSPSFIGIVTVANPSSTSGMVTIFPGPNQIGSVTVSNFTAPNVGNVTLNASNAYIGIATVVPIISSTVVNFLVSTASGGKTQFPTNTVRQGIIQAYSENVSNVFIGNSAVTSGISDTRGMELQAGQAAGVEIDQTNKLYLALATGASGAVSFLGSG
jgi:hypothetical protein